VFRFSLTKKSYDSLKKIWPIYDEAIECVFEGSQKSEIKLVAKTIDLWIQNLMKPHKKWK
jgi:hypothetical protein